MNRQSSFSLVFQARYYRYCFGVVEYKLLSRLFLSYFLFSRQYLGQGYDSKKEMPGGRITLGQIDSVSA